MELLYQNVSTANNQSAELCFKNRQVAELKKDLSSKEDQLHAMELDKRGAKELLIEAESRVQQLTLENTVKDNEIELKDRTIMAIRTEISTLRRLADIQAIVPVGKCKGRKLV